MKKSFIVGSLLLTQYICAASDLGKESDSELSKIHTKLNIEQSIDIYGEHTSREFKKEHVTKLLAERLTILCNFMRSYNQKAEKDYYHHKSCLERNEVVLVNNVTDNELEEIFEKTYDSQSVQIDHIKNIATCLQRRVDDPITQENLRAVIERCQSWKEKNNGDISLADIRAAHFIPEEKEEYESSSSSRNAKETKEKYTESKELEDPSEIHIISVPLGQSTPPKGT